MDGENRAVPGDVEDTETRFLHNVCHGNFYRVTELLYRQQQDELSLRTAPERETVRFRASASTVFPLRDIESLEKNAAGQYIMTTTFLGLSGSSSPLPGYYLDNLAWQQAQGNSTTVDFLGMFTHRWTQFLYHIRRKYRWYTRFRPDGTDTITQRMYALIGLGNPRVRERLNICHTKLLAYAGTLAGAGRSPDIICNLVSHCFDLPKVTLQPWQFRRVAIPVDQQTRLGVTEPGPNGTVRGRSVLGKNFVLGERVPDRGGKFMLCIDNLPLTRYLAFLPEGEEYLPLTTLVSFLMRDQLAWDLRLGLEPDAIDGMRLGDKRCSQLGRTCFIGKPPKEAFVTITVRR